MKKKRKHENLIISIIIVFMISGIFIINKIIDDTLEKNKFVAEIWGTVSDWYMVIVTMITAIFLYKTLKSQKDVQESQAIIQEIEVMRFRKSIEPNFYIEGKSNTEEKPNSKTYKFKLEPTGHVSKNIEFISDHKLNVTHFRNKFANSPSKIYSSVNNDNTQQYVNINKSIKGEQYLVLEVTITEIEYKKQSIFDSLIIIRFEDEAKYKYEKHISLKYPNTEDNENIRVVRIISDLIYC